MTSTWMYGCFLSSWETSPITVLSLPPEDTRSLCSCSPSDSHMEQMGSSPSLLSEWVKSWSPGSSRTRSHTSQYSGLASTHLPTVWTNVQIVRPALTAVRSSCCRNNCLLQWAAVLELGARFPLSVQRACALWQFTSAAFKDSLKNQH